MGRLSSLPIRIIRRLKRIVYRRMPGLHDRVMRAYQQSGWIQRRLEIRKLDSLIDELADLVEEGQGDGRLQPQAADRLRALVTDLRRENR